MYRQIQHEYGRSFAHSQTWLSGLLHRLHVTQYSHTFPSFAGAIIAWFRPRCMCIQTKQEKDQSDYLHLGPTPCCSLALSPLSLTDSLLFLSLLLFCCYAFLPVSLITHSPISCSPFYLPLAPSSFSLSPPLPLFHWLISRHTLWCHAQRKDYTTLQQS